MQSTEASPGGTDPEIILKSIMLRETNTFTKRGVGRFSCSKYPAHDWMCSHCPYRDEAEMEYLKIAQDLEMYGVSYFAITVSVNDCLDVSVKLHVTS